MDAILESLDLTSAVHEVTAAREVDRIEAHAKRERAKFDQMLDDAVYEYEPQSFPIYITVWHEVGHTSEPWGITYRCAITEGDGVNAPNGHIMEATEEQYREFCRLYEAGKEGGS